MINNLPSQYRKDPWILALAAALQSKLEAIPNVSSVTFLTAGEALERYTERVTSRLLDKGACLRVGFVGGDVRRERRRKGKEA